MRITTRISAALLSVGLLVCFLSSAVYLLGTNASVMEALMRRTAPPEDTYLPEDDYLLAVRTITDYLTGRVEEFQFTFTMDDTNYLAFNAKEQQHMADCRVLFQLCGRIAAASCTMVLLLVCLLLVRRERTAFSLLGRLIAVEILLLMVLVILAACFFTDAFTLFHHLLFSNDLWLLNPQTDLLVRLMPTAFFTHYALLIATAVLLTLMLSAVLARIAAHPVPNHRKKELS